MVYFQNNFPNFGKFWRALRWKISENFMAIWYILLPFAIFYGHLVYLTAICYILWPLGIFVVHLDKFSRFGILYQEKSGNPVQHTSNAAAKYLGYLRECRALEFCHLLSAQRNGSDVNSAMIICSANTITKTMLASGGN
jgi:hypothetical protein